MAMHIYNKENIEIREQHERIDAEAFEAKGAKAVKNDIQPKENPKISQGKTR